MRMLRGVKPLVDYLDSIGTPVGQSTIYNLLRENKIPHTRPSPRVLLFDLNAIDEWLIGGKQNE